MNVCSAQMSGYNISLVGILRGMPLSLADICFEVAECKFRIIGDIHVFIFCFFFFFLIFKINSYSIGWKDLCSPVWTIYIV